jgi:hypothetical protein
MKLLEELTEIGKETTCILFSLCLNPKGDWKMYIYQSKIIIIGPLEVVVAAAIKEFTTNRELLADKYRYHNSHKGKKYRYFGMPKPKVQSSNLNESNAYNLKFGYAKTLGFKNIADAYARIGKQQFEQQFKDYNNTLKL